VSAQIRDYLDQLIPAFRGGRHAVDTATLERLHAERDFAGVLRWIKKAMQLDLRLGMRIVDAAAGAAAGPVPASAPMWIEMPRPMPARGSAAFRNTRAIINARRDFLDSRPFAFVVAGFAHELSHVVLAAAAHRLQDDEKAVDLTAMVLGYEDFIADAELTKHHGLLSSALLALALAPLGVLFWKGGSTETARIGYLTTEEAQFAQQYLAQRLARP
jgi:hypothetical protein